MSVVSCPAGGLSPDHTRWIRSRDNYFLPKEVLAELFPAVTLVVLKSVFSRRVRRFATLQHTEAQTNTDR
jgi:hypothetical protein